MRKYVWQKEAEPPARDMSHDRCACGLVRPVALYRHIDRVRQHEKSVRAIEAAGLLNSPSACDLSDCGLFAIVLRLRAVAGQLGVLRHRGARPRVVVGPVCENLRRHTPRYGKLAKICTGNLTGSGLRKYALRQNHTIPVYHRYRPFHVSVLSRSRVCTHTPQHTRDTCTLYF